MINKKTWKEIPIGGLIDKAGSAKEYKTGDWRTFKPVRDQRCIHCMLCWIYCPDTSIYAKDEKQTGFDYDHCKGCGICAQVCPVKCIDMVANNETIPPLGIIEGKKEVKKEVKVK